MKSIIHNGENCFICGRRASERHHIFGASNRNWSEKYGLTVNLCHWCHNEPPNGVHFNRDLDLKLKALAQKKFNETYPEENFIEIFGRNYL